MGAHSSHTQGRARPTLPKSAHLRCPWSRSKTLTWGSSLESEHKGPKAQEAEREPHGAACPAAKVNAPGLGRCNTGRGWGEGANEGPELISGCTCDAARTGSQWAAQPRTPHFPVRARRAALGGASIWTSTPPGRRCGCRGLRGLPRSPGGVQLWVPGTIRVQVGEVPVPRTTPSHNLERQLRAQRVT